MVFTDRQEALVKESWKLMKQNVPDLSFQFFTTILELAPAAKGMFSFLQDTEEIPQNNPKLKAHAVIVFKMTCNASVQLAEKGKIDLPEKTLKFLGSVHVEKAVIDPHFEVVKNALLTTIKGAVGEMWSDEMSSAWGLAYDELATAVKTEMKQEIDHENASA